MLLLVTASVVAFRRTLTISPSHLLASALPFPIHVTLLADGIPRRTLRLPPHSAPAPLMLHGPREAGPAVISR